MAVQEAGSAPTPGAQVVANAFVEQYYHILHQSPGLVHRFYQDSSVLGRPDVSGNITTVKTTQVSASLGMTASISSRTITNAAEKT